MEGAALQLVRGCLEVSDTCSLGASSLLLCSFPFSISKCSTAEVTANPASSILIVLRDQCFLEVNQMFPPLHLKYMSLSTYMYTYICIEREKKREKTFSHSCQSEQILFKGNFLLCLVLKETGKWQKIELTKVTKFFHQLNIDEMSFTENSGNEFHGGLWKWTMKCKARY